MIGMTINDVKQPQPGDRTDLPVDGTGDPACQSKGLPEIQERLRILCAQAGDREAFCALVEAYDRRLLYFVRRILGETGDALDVLQSVWLTVHRGLPGLRSPDAFRVWLYRIAHDQAITELRRKSRAPLIDPLESYPPAQDLDFDSTAFESAELVHKGLRDLSIDHRRVLTLRFLEEMSIAEIAEVVGQNAGTIKSRLHYAKVALRRRIEELSHE